MKRVAAGLAVCFLAACGPSAPPCSVYCTAPTIDASDDVSWELAVFHVQVCVNAICDDVDTMRGGPAVTLPNVHGTAKMGIPSSGHESELELTLDDGTVTTGDTVHVVVTQPGTGVVVCDMSAHVIDATAPECACQRHTLDAWVTAR